MSGLLTNFHFLRPAWLLLALLAIGLWWLWQRKTDPLQGWRQQIDPELLSALVVGKEANLRATKAQLLAAWLLTVVAIAGPTWRLAPNPFADDATPLVVLLKAEASMNVADPEPSRLERAKLKLADLTAERKGQPLGLIAYAGSAHLVLPPTRDTDVVRQMANEISPEIMPEPGDRLDLALLEAQRILAESETSGSILVIADSIATDLPALSEAAKAVALPIQILAIDSPDSPEQTSILTAAKRIGASVQKFTPDDSDIKKIVQTAARAPLMVAGDESDHWMEMGYYLVPVVALLFLFVFRQETAARGVA
ncbi:vWA domain-containing protein [Bythopirellula goksoeyrii]|uniref:VWFA domain-containing protein n=1 Tax=Bythopirellula goksoeyrii TaxID=1400387 RepID=A0A5B9QC90_9BACT|nr:VWA domain-containing protein [Bythopirellula goksoeyrii]QEG35220.1 hypothetical protein Pr1d_25140 [Bythopirellula goksoeyrii]